MVGLFNRKIFSAKLMSRFFFWAGVSLKKAANRKLKAKKEPEADQSNNIFALMKMRELIQDSDEGISRSLEKISEFWVWEDDSEDDSWDS